jgi:hypothetical protein
MAVLWFVRGWREPRRKRSVLIVAGAVSRKSRKRERGFSLDFWVGIVYQEIARPLTAVLIDVIFLFMYILDYAL